MDYIGFSIYQRLFMGDRQSLADIKAARDDPDAIFTALATTVDTLVNAFVNKHHVGGVVHFCDLESLFGQDIITQPWQDVERAWYARRSYPFALGFHVNFSHDNLPLATGFVDTFRKTMSLCNSLGVDAVVMHAPLITTKDTDRDFIEIMTSPRVVDAMNLCKASICWENAQDTIATYRDLGRLVAWRRQLVDRLEQQGHRDLARRQLFCFDTGHLLLSLQRDGASATQVTRHLPDFAKHVKVFHIHANDGTKDQHLIPFLDVKKYKLDAVNERRFKENSQLVTSWVHTCLQQGQIDGRHVHVESGPPMPVDEIIAFYQRLLEG
jgi:sugar phosphate isomerase/epimerase